MTTPPKPKGSGVAAEDAAPPGETGGPATGAVSQDAGTSVAGASAAGAVAAHDIAASPAPAPVSGPVAAGGSVSRTVRLLAVIFGCLGLLSTLARALVVVDDVSLRLWYGGLVGLSVALYILALLRTPRSAWARHTLLAVQCLVVAVTVAVAPHDVDFMNGLFVPLAGEAAIVFSGGAAWIWVGVVAALTAAPLTGLDDAAEGFARALFSLALEAVFVAYVVVARDLETARRRSQSMLDDLRTAHAQLEAYAARAGELAAMGERDRVARDLNESVASRIAGVLAAAEEARRVLATHDARGGGAVAEEPTAGGGPAAEAAPVLAAIQAETQQALADMRGLIEELRPRLPA